MMPTISLRVPDDALTEIDRRARARGLNRTAFLLGVALMDDLNETAEEKRFEEIETRLEVLEAATWPGLRGAGRPAQGLG